VSNPLTKSRKPTSLTSHPSSLYYAPELIQYIKSNPDVLQRLKSKYGNLLMGMIDGMDATFGHNPQKWNKDPKRFLDWFSTSEAEKEIRKEISSLPRENLKKEGSMVSGIKGFSAPFGSKPKKGSKKKNPSKPFGEAELFETALGMALLGEDDIGEVVKKRGNMWVYYDDDTEADKGTFKDRETAWERQRLDRGSKKGKKRPSEKERQAKSLRPAIEKKPEPAKPNVAPKPKMAKKAEKEKKKQPQRVRQESIMKDLLNPLNEGSMISYVFENSPVTEDSVAWEKFVGKLSRQTVMSDPKLRAIITKMAKAEGNLLKKAVDLVDGILSPTGRFDVSTGKLELEPDTKDVKLNFAVNAKESKTKVGFSIKLENGRPLILFPPETKAALNNTPSEDSKLLRAELMHAQETVLDNMEDVVKVTEQRDKYLQQLQDKMDKFVNSINPLEISMLRYLLKNKYKGVK